MTTTWSKISNRRHHYQKEGSEHFAEITSFIDETIKKWAALADSYVITHQQDTADFGVRITIM